MPHKKSRSRRSAKVQNALLAIGVRNRHRPALGPINHPRKVAAARRHPGKHARVQPKRVRQAHKPQSLFPSGRESNTNRRHQVVTEDEYITDINGSTAFSTTPYALNPGQSATFPWAYKIAALYERWRTRYVEFYYKPQVSAYATNGQSGKVMLSFDYNASDSAPTTKQQVEDTRPHADAMPYEVVRLRLDPKLLNSQDSKYVRPGGQPAGTDLKTYDGGVLYVSTDGNANANVIGELRVRYSFELMTPVLESSVLPNVGAFAHIVEGASQTATNTSPLGTTGGIVQSSSTLLGTAPTMTTFLMPQVGTFVVAGSWAGASIAAAPTLVAGANIVNVNALKDDGGHLVSSFLNAGTAANVLACFNVIAAGTGSGNTVTIGALTGMSGGQADVLILQVSSSLNALKPADSPIDERLKRLERLLALVDPEDCGLDDDTVSVTSMPLTNNNGNSQSSSCASAIIRRALSRKA